MGTYANLWYVGKEGERVEVGLGQKVVEKLTRELVGGQYHIYFDNFFTESAR